MTEQTGSSTLKIKLPINDLRNNRISGCLRGGEANVLDCDIVVREFEFNLLVYVYF